jgi:hypothetical protein
MIGLRQRHMYRSHGHNPWHTFTDDKFMYNTDLASYYIHHVLPVAILEVQPNIFSDSHSGIGNVAVKLCLLANVRKNKLASDLYKCGVSQLGHFDHSGKLNDLKKSMANLWKAVKLTNDSHPTKLAHLNSLGGCHGHRFEHLSTLNNLNSAISNIQKATQLTDDGHPAKLDYLDHLSHSQLRRYQTLSMLTDLNDAISNHQKAVQFTEDGHPKKPTYLAVLGINQVTRYKIQ